MTLFNAEVSAPETPMWFGPPSRPLFGWLCRPADGTARGAVILAPPIGREARAARRALRHLAATLAEYGFASLRVDYDGTGDSFGTLDEPGRDDAWVSSVGHAVAELRDLGATSVSAVGMRLGATIVGVAADRLDLGLDSLVLWDPCESGRTYLRELSALETLRREHVDVRPDGAVETAEFVFTEQTAGEMRALNLQSGTREHLAERILVLSREGRLITDKLRRRLEREKVDWETTSEQAALLGVDPMRAVVPLAALHTIVTWLAAPNAARAPLAAPSGAPEVRLVVAPGRAVLERCVQLGPGSLFGITTEPEGAVADGPWIIFANVANEDHSGPSRLWVEFARRWAAHGLRCLRMDLRGLGDSPRLADWTLRSMYDVGWPDDLVDGARAVSADDPSDVVFVGLCSGAYLAAEAGLAIGARGVCSINPPVGLDFLAGVLTLERSPRASVRALAGELKEVAVRARWASVVAWRVLRLVMPRTFGRDLLASVAASGTDLFVLSSSEDLVPSQRLVGTERFFSPQLVSPSNYEVDFVPGLDHSMHVAAGRDLVIDKLDRHVLACFAGTGPASAEHLDEEDT
jgi:alpha-beta hydrolase superfamily lysophospholipase